MRRLEELAENEQFDQFSRREVRRETYTVAQCMALILRRVEKGDVSFFSLFEESSDKEEVISVFLAILELIKNGRVSAEQDDGYGDITIRKRVKE